MARKVLLALMIGCALVVALSACGSAPTLSRDKPTTNQPSQSVGGWQVILNNTSVQSQYNGTDPADPSDVFLVIDVSFANTSSNMKQLQPSWDLVDDTGNHFQESTASDPNQVFNVDAGQSVEATSAFEVPGNEDCKFTLYLNHVGDTQSWTITCPQ